MSNGFWRLVTGVIVLLSVGEPGRAAESWTGRGPVVFRAALPPSRDGAWEPLLSVGVPGSGDVVFCRRLADGRMVFGWEQTGRAAALSDPVPVGDTSSHELLVSLGSLLSREDENLNNPVFAKLRGLAIVQCDGHTVLIAKGDFTPEERPAVLGRNQVGGALAQAVFSGPIDTVTRADLKSVLAAAINPSRLIAEDQGAGAEMPEFPGPIKLRLMFPGGGAGHNEPLLVTGIPGSGDFIYVRYEDDQHLRLGYDHWRVGGPLSEPLTCDVTVAHEVVISMGCLFPPITSARADPPPIMALRDRCVVLLDGRVVLNGTAKFYPTKADQITLFTNTIGGSTADPVFTGTILRVERVKPAEILRVAPAL